VTEEQRSQRAFRAKTLRAAGLLAAAVVGSALKARCGDSRASPPRLRPKSLAAEPLVFFRHALKLIETIRNADGGYGGRCGDLVEFLAYSGCRKSEAARVRGRDCDFEKGELVILGDPATGTKNWEIRRVPMIPDMRRLLERIQKEREEFTANPVMRVHECQGAINTACRKLGIARFTHHDLRHLFATRCIESGVDIPTVSRWLGHKDGGALAMKVYGHLRDQHSAEMAQKVTFTQGSALVSNALEEKLLQTVQCKLSCLVAGAPK
jgi:integrase